MRWPLAAGRSLLSTERCPFLSLSSRRRRFCSQGRYCSEAARGHWTMLAQTDDVDRLESAERWNVIASFGHAIRWSYRRSPPVSRKPDGEWALPRCFGDRAHGCRSEYRLGAPILSPMTGRLMDTLVGVVSPSRCLQKSRCTAQRWNVSPSRRPLERTPPNTRLARSTSTS